MCRAGACIIARMLARQQRFIKEKYINLITSSKVLESDLVDEDTETKAFRRHFNRSKKVMCREHCIRTLGFKYIRFVLALVPDSSPYTLDFFIFTIYYSLLLPRPGQSASC